MSDESIGAQRRTTRTVTVIAADLGVAILYFCALRWLIPRSGVWSGAVLVLSLIAIAALVIQSSILRRRLREK